MNPNRITTTLAIGDVIRNRNPGQSYTVARWSMHNGEPLVHIRGEDGRVFSRTWDQLRRNWRMVKRADGR